MTSHGKRQREGEEKCIPKKYLCIEKILNRPLIEGVQLCEVRKFHNAFQSWHAQQEDPYFSPPVYDQGLRFLQGCHRAPLYGDVFKQLFILNDYWPKAAWRFYHQVDEDMVHSEDQKAGYVSIARSVDEDLPWEENNWTTILNSIKTAIRRSIDYELELQQRLECLGDTTSFPVNKCTVGLRCLLDTGCMAGPMVQRRLSEYAESKLTQVPPGGGKTRVFSHIFTLAYTLRESSYGRIIFGNQGLSGIQDFIGELDLYRYHTRLYRTNKGSVRYPLALDLWREDPQKVLSVSNRATRRPRGSFLKFIITVFIRIAMLMVQGIREAIQYYKV
jgi:hypothetical protein